MRSFISKKGFTLIELLIVVAIIAILAAIAVPNFLESQVRAKVSRARADMRSVAVALEAYSVDYNKFPLVRGEGTLNYLGHGARNPQDVVSPPGAPTRTFNQATLPLELTTPTAYVTSTFKDPFKDLGARRFSAPSGALADANIVVATDPTTRDYSYHNIYQYFSMWKRNPPPLPKIDYGFHDEDMAEYGQWRLTSIGPDKEFYGSIGRRVYDSTNGTMSKGDIIRSQNSSAGVSKEATTGNN